MKINSNFLLACSASLLLVSCGGNESTAPETPKGSTVSEAPSIKYDTEKLLGLYMGEFGKSTIMLQLNYVQGKNASGFNILRGNKRNMKGSVGSKGATYYFILEEPGNDKYDGKFEFEIDTSSFELIGKWIPNDPKSAELKEFSLKKVEKIEADPNLVGDWTGGIDNISGTMSFRKDGTCTFDGSEYIDMENEDRYEPVKVSGTWIENEKGIRIEFEKHARLKRSVITLKRNKDPEMDMVILEDGEHVHFYPYGMYF